MSLHTAAMLASLSISKFTNGKKDNDATRDANAQQNANEKAGYYRKCLIDPAALKEIAEIESAARKLHRESTLPWGRKGEQLLPAKLHQEYITQMRQYKQDFASAVTRFIAQWPSLVSDAQAILGNMYNPNEYPSQTEIASHFSFDIDIQPVPESNDFRVEVNQSELEQLKEDLAKKLRAREQVAMSNLWERLYEPVKHIAEKLSDPNARIHESILVNLSNIINILPKLNIQDDPVLNSMAEDIANKLCSVETKILRKNKDVRKQVAEEANGIVDIMNEAMARNEEQQEVSAA